MNALDLIAFGQSYKVSRSPVRNREIGPFGQSTRILFNVRDSELVVQGSESSQGDTISIIEKLEDGKRRSIHHPIDSSKTLYDLYASKLLEVTSGKLRKYISRSAKEYSDRN